MTIRTLMTVAVMACVVALSGCSTTGLSQSNYFAGAYKASKDGAFTLPAIAVSKIDREFRRQIVDYDTKERSGTVIVDTKNCHPYLVQHEGKAPRYGIGVGRDGFRWSGTA